MNYEFCIMNYLRLSQELKDQSHLVGSKDTLVLAVATADEGIAEFIILRYPGGQAVQGCRHAEIGCIGQGNLLLGIGLDIHSLCLF